MNIRKMVLFAALILCAAMVWTAPAPVHGAEATPTPAFTLIPSAEVTHTPFPPEYLTNSQETVGITIAGAVIVLIVVIGVIVFMPRKVKKE